MKIIIIEDEPAVARMYQLKLTRQGFEVLMAEDGLDGLNLISEQEPEIALLDLMMPNMDGFEMLERLRAMPKRPATKIAVLTNMGDSEIEARARSCGAHDYIVKSDNTPSEVAQRVQDLIKR
jgi:DNA-binding response OmpR family regulator